MPTSEKQGLLKKSTLAEDEIAEIMQLAALCNERDGLHMRIPASALRQRSGKESDDFLFYEQGALVGYLYVDSWGEKEKEMTGMVAPEFRRRGIFRQLFEAAKEECKARGVECMILVCEQKSRAGHAFARAVRAHHDFSEHEMVLGNFRERKQTDPQFHIRPATLDDREALILIIASDMGDQEDAREMVEKLFAAPDQQLYLATLGDQPLGTLRLDYQNEVVGIYGFVVRPEYRGHGYGRQMLEYVIRRVTGEDSRPIMLEVETENHNAIGLYSSCGFQNVTTYDYFNHDI